MGENSGGNTAIPNHLWELIAEKGKYLKCIIDFCGYTDVDDVILLKDPENLRKMLDFAADMAETVTNKSEMYGPFATNPKNTLCDARS